MKEKMYYFVVGVPAVDRAGRVKDYIIAAVESWSGQFHPDDPMFGTLHNKVTAQQIKGAQ